MKVSSYTAIREALFAEFDAYFKTYPLDVSRQLETLDKWDQALDTPYPFERKALVYKAAQICPVKVFRTSPFFFELQSGRIRNSSENGFPPGPGLEGWYMRKHMDMARAFQTWSAPYKAQDLIWCDIFADFAHHTVGYEQVLEKGFSGILADIAARREKVCTPEQSALLAAMDTGARAMMAIAENFAREAERMLATESDAQARANLQAIATVARRVPAAPAQTLYEALCVILFLREVVTAIEGVAVAVLGGHLDRILQKYYEADLRAGRVTPEEAQNLIDHFLTITDARWDMTCDFASTNNSLTIGGVDEAGNIVWNDVSRMIVNAYEAHRFVNPKVQARLTPSHPVEAFERIAHVIRQGVNVFSVLNDEVIIQSNVRMGKRLRDARRYVAGGCQEPMLERNEFNNRAFCYINLPQIVNSLFDRDLTAFFTRENTGFTPTYTFDSFEAVYLEFVNRLRFIFLGVAEKLNAFDVKLPVFNPCPLLSATQESCVVRAMDYTQGGCTYNATSVPLVGIGTAIDSLLAISEAVFEKKLCSMEALGAVLKSDFAGEERLRGYLLNRCPKFGMDTPEVNAFSARLFRDAARVTSGIRNSRGGLYEASLFVFYLFDWMKNATGATADGRSAGTVLSRGMNPPDSSGFQNIANLLHTLLALDMKDYPGCGVTYLEMPVASSGVTDALLSEVMMAFLRSGGSALDLNLLDPLQLQEARRYPERYSRLIVRVCGFSAYFTSLKANIQEEIIQRAFVDHG